jgi:hypothetical protein
MIAVRHRAGEDTRPLVSVAASSNPSPAPALPPPPVD